MMRNNTVGGPPWDQKRRALPVLWNRKGSVVLTVGGRRAARGHRSGSGTLGGQSGPSGFVATHRGAWVILV